MPSARSAPPEGRASAEAAPGRAGPIAAGDEWDSLATRYRQSAQDALAQSILPFWSRAIDARHGGVFTCWNNAGTELVSRDKFTWSQGRFVWLWARLAGLAARGVLPGDADAYLAHARSTVEFLRRHALLPDGRCAFLASENGAVKEPFVGAGPAPSIYADCFVTMGFAEFARVSGDAAALEDAWRLFTEIELRLAAGGVPTHPDPIPAGYDSHALAMIVLNVALVLRDACAACGDSRRPAIRARTVAAAQRIFEQFMLVDGRIAELRPHAPGEEGTLLARHCNPGHSLESLWLLQTVASDAGRADWLARAHAAVNFAFERGWDPLAGGLLHYVDTAGGEPRGIAGDSVYEKAVRNTWDLKLWWVHSEALYASLLSYRLSADPRPRAWFERTWEYAFRTFPQPDSAVGEWIQIRDRHGDPVERVVALPVKDPYHIARNLILILELFSETRLSSVS